MSAAAQLTITPTTTLSAETASASSGFNAQTNGNLGVSNVSKLPIRSLLCLGSTTIYAVIMSGFGRIKSVIAVNDLAEANSRGGAVKSAFMIDVAALVFGFLFVIVSSVRRSMALACLAMLSATLLACGGSTAPLPAAPAATLPTAALASPTPTAPTSPSPPSPAPPTSGGSALGNVSGTVTSLADGRVIDGAQVTLASATIIADTNGHYAFDNMLPGSYTLTASSPGYLARNYGVVVTNGTTVQNVQLSVAGIVAGTITSGSGSPIDGAAIQFSGGVLNETLTVTTDGRGRYNTSWIPIGTYTLTISAFGYDGNSATETVNTGQTTIANIMLVSNAPGPRVGWVVVTLPNSQVTPNWRNYAPADCQPDPTVCVDDHRFWEEFDFTNFTTAIDASFRAIASQGKYHGVFIIMALADSPTYSNNIRLIFDSASAHGLVFEPVLFPKREWGKEWCYLYPYNAPTECVVVPGTTTAVAYQKMINWMNFVQNLGGACDSGSYNRPFAIWYGWSEFTPGYGALLNFWQSLPNSSCHYRSAYVTWLDEPFLTNSDVAELQAHVVNDLQLPFWINTEMYISANLIQNHRRYAPYQTIVTGYAKASDVTVWGHGICGLWTSAGRPEELGVWTFFDRDVSPIEQYRAYIDGSISDVSSMCAI